MIHKIKQNASCRWVLYKEKMVRGSIVGDSNRCGLKDFWVVRRLLRVIKVLEIVRTSFEVKFFAKSSRTLSRLADFHWKSLVIKEKEINLDGDRFYRECGSDKTDSGSNVGEEEEERECSGEETGE